MSTGKPKSGEFCWNELSTLNPKQAKEFYHALLGWESRDMEAGDCVYTIFKSGDKDIGGMYEIPKDKKDMIPPVWLSYIAVDDVDSIVTKAQSLGAQVRCPATSVGDYGRFAVVADPTGATIAFWQALKEC